MAGRIFDMMREHLDDNKTEQFELAVRRKRPPKWTKYFTPLTPQLLEQVIRERELTRLANATATGTDARNLSAANLYSNGGGDTCIGAGAGTGAGGVSNSADMASGGSNAGRLEVSQVCTTAAASPLPHAARQHRRKPIPVEPNPEFEAGKKLPSELARLFPQHKLAGIPLMELDDYYRDKMTFVVIARDKTIFRFTASKCMFLFGPLHPIRRACIYALVHPLFSFLVLTSIIVNCAFMTQKDPPPLAEYIFTAIYTVEASIKAVARGVILSPFTYLRDWWNWLDFVVISLAYLMFVAPILGNLSALRSLRVLRALKTVAAAQGLRTIVMALMEAVKRLRDVSILSLFVLSIFALIGLQMYKGALRKKCILNPPQNYTGDEELWFLNETNWYLPGGSKDVCGDDVSVCPENYTCKAIGSNPNYGFTSFDNFFWSLLCAFRLMTQDYWENLYQMVLRSMGSAYVFFFMLVIFFGSFYLVNVILAIVAMSYNDSQKTSSAEEEEAAKDESNAKALESDPSVSKVPASSKAARPTVECQNERGINLPLVQLDDVTTSFVRRDYCQKRQGLLFKQQRDPDTASIKSDELWHEFIKTSDGIRLLQKEYHLHPRKMSRTPIELATNVRTTPQRNAKIDNVRAIMQQATRMKNPAKLLAPTLIAEQSTESIVNVLKEYVMSRRKRSHSASVLPGFTYEIQPSARQGQEISRLTVPPTTPTPTPTPVAENPAFRHSHSPFRESKLVQKELEDDVFGFIDDSKAATPYKFVDRDVVLAKYFLKNSPSHNKLIFAQLGIDQPRIGSLARSNTGKSTLASCSNQSTIGNAHLSNTLRHLRAIQTYTPTKSEMLSERFREKPLPTVDQSAAENSLQVNDDEPSALSISDLPLEDEMKKLADLIEQMDDDDDDSDYDSEDSSVVRRRQKKSIGRLIADRLNKLLCSWECCPFWKSMQYYVCLFVLDPFIDLFITLCIILNTLFMALDHHPMSPSLRDALQHGNYFFTATFIVEALLKIIALNPVIYFHDSWNCFDAVVVAFSLIELSLENVQGLSVLRSFRLLRVFKLAKSWPTLNKLIRIIISSMAALGNLIIVLIIVIFIFAVVGMQIFSQGYYDNISKFPNGVLPRWNFTDFWHSFMIVFRVLCGEYIESMWDCMLANGMICVPFFVLTMVLGNLVVLKLFLALLLSSFALLGEEDNETELNKLQEAVDRINRFIVWFKIKLKRVLIITALRLGICTAWTLKSGGRRYLRSSTQFDKLQKDRAYSTCSTLEHHCGVITVYDGSNNTAGFCSTQLSPDAHFNVPLCKVTSECDFGHENLDKHTVSFTITSPENGNANGNGRNYNSNNLFSKASAKGAGESNGGSNGRVENRFDHVVSYADNLTFVDSEVIEEFDPAHSSPVKIDAEPEVTQVDLIYWNDPEDCCPKTLTRHFAFWSDSIENSRIGACWWMLRKQCYRVCSHKYFESFIIIMISLSSVSLAVEDVHLPSKPILEEILQISDKIFTFIFLGEAILKWFAYGLSRYFKDAWCWLDFVIVVIALISLIGEGSEATANMGAFKAMRTLRALRPLRAVSRWEGMKVVVNALIQAIPSIFNVMLVCLVFWLIFAIIGVQLFGGMFYKCLDENKHIMDSSVVNNKSDCEALRAQGRNVSWENSRINFDNVGMAYLALFQVATFKGWIEIIRDATDIRGVELQPSLEHSYFYCIYFVLFITLGSFFTLNLFIGVIIDNFNRQKRKAGGSIELFMTEDQKKYYRMMKQLSSKKPQKPIPKPRYKLGVKVYALVQDQRFDIFVMIVILANMFTMCLEYDGQSETSEKVLEIINHIFVGIFTTEAVLKLVALRWYYFTQPWNVFDLTIVVMSLMATQMEEILNHIKVDPTVIRIVRVVRIGRVLRLVKGAKGIRTLLFSLMISLPALFNIALLLFLVMFIYSIFGISFFSRVNKVNGLDEMFNFETFPRSFILLFQLCTSAGWNGVLDALMNDSPPYCDPNKKPHSDCGNAPVAIAFLCTYLIISFLVVINMYIAVILENFSQANDEVQQGLTQDDFDMYYEKWEKYDLKAKGYIRLNEVYDFLDELDEPLKVRKPNKLQVANLDIPICEDDMVNCVDLLDALTRKVLGTNVTPEELEQLRPKDERKNYVPISSTGKRWREERSARLIAKAWKMYVVKKNAPTNDIVSSESDNAKVADDGKQHLLVPTTGT